MLPSEAQKSLLLAYVGLLAEDVTAVSGQWNTLQAHVTGFATHKPGTRPYLRFASPGGTSQVFPRTTQSRQVFPMSVPHVGHLHRCCVSKDGDVLVTSRRPVPDHNFGSISNPCDELDIDWLKQFQIARQTLEAESQ